MNLINSFRSVIRSKSPPKGIKKKGKIIIIKNTNITEKMLHNTPGICIRTWFPYQYVLTFFIKPFWRFYLMAPTLDLNHRRTFYNRSQDSIRIFLKYLTWFILKVKEFFLLDITNDDKKHDQFGFKSNVGATTQNMWITTSPFPERYSWDITLLLNVCFHVSQTKDRTLYVSDGWFREWDTEMTWITELVVVHFLGKKKKKELIKTCLF